MHKSLLLEAELARSRKDDWAAADLFDKAIRAASAGGFLQEESFARERAGLFWLDKGLERIATVYLSEARSGYELWGAARKAEMLRVEHATLLAGEGRIAQEEHGSSTPYFTLVSSSGAALDFASVMKASRAISGEINLEQLTKQLIRIAVETAGARRGVILLSENRQLTVGATSTAGDEDKVFSPPLPIAEYPNVPVSVINLVSRTGETLSLANATEDPRFSNDPMVERARPLSVLAVPIQHRMQTQGVLYLEHDLAANVFTPDRATILEGLAAQAAISLQNARLFEERKKSEARLRDALTEVEQLKAKLEAENLYLAEEIKSQHGFEEIVGESKEIKQLLKSVATVAPTDASVLILGETGTGKELVARAVHDRSNARAKTLVKVNCAALPGNLIESELFGHERGAFTGALSRKIGRFELANGGTIFLDEIGDLPLDLQAKLLRVLQEGEFERVGSVQTIQVQVRVIAATNRDLEKAVEEERFRADLYYRLNVFPVQIPPLRDRPDDISLLVRRFASRYAAKLGREIESIPAPAMKALQTYHWPGNVRELQNVIERAVILSDGPVLNLADWMPKRPAGTPAELTTWTLRDVEKRHILKVLEKTGWQVSGERGAARLLDLKPTTLDARMRKLGIRRPGKKLEPTQD